jgi:N-dimethylarginine dimethylaminohydrolase
MEENFNMNIIKIEMNEEYLYHLDCSLFPLNPDTIMMCTELYDSSEIADIERYSNIIDVDIDDAYSEITNCVRLGNSILAPSSISEMTKSDKYYYEEKHKIATLEKICSDEGYEPVFFNLEEFHKSGAALSCLIMNLNRVSHLKSYV